MTTLRRPLPKVGRQAERWGRWRSRQRGLVGLRCRGRCEVCGAEGVSLDVHHVAGRRHVVEEPFASWHLLLAGLCRSCHNSVHGEPLGAAAVKVQAACVSRLEDRFDGKVLEPWPDPRPLDVIREHVRRLAEEGFDPMEDRV